MSGHFMFGDSRCLDRIELVTPADKVVEYIKSEWSIFPPNNHPKGDGPSVYRCTRFREHGHIKDIVLINFMQGVVTVKERYYKGNRRGYLGTRTGGEKQTRVFPFTTFTVKRMNCAECTATDCHKSPHWIRPTWMRSNTTTTTPDAVFTAL